MNVAARARRRRRAVARAQARLSQLLKAVERFSPAQAVWGTPYGAGFLLRHVLLAGEEARLWRFGLMPQAPEPEEVRAIFEAAAPAAFGAAAPDILAQVAACAGHEAEPAAAEAFALGMRRADRILAAMLHGRWGDPFVAEAAARYRAIKASLKKPNVLFSPSRRYAYLVASALCADHYQAPLRDQEAIAALWPRALRT